MRYFVNRLADYASGQPVQIDAARWTQYILNTVKAIRLHMPPTTENCDGGLYVGCAGVGYALYRLASTERLSASRDRLLAAATEYVDVALQYATRRRGRDPTTAFLLGPAGALVVGSLVLDAVGRSAAAADLRKQYAAMASAVSKPGDFLGCGSDEYFVGRAGYLCGLLVLNSAYRQQVTGRICFMCIHNNLFSCFSCWVVLAFSHCLQECMKCYCEIFDKLSDSGR